MFFRGTFKFRELVHFYCFSVETEKNTANSTNSKYKISLDCKNTIQSSPMLKKDKFKSWIKNRST